MEENGKFLETACDLILLHSVLVRKMYFQRRCGPKLGRQPFPKAQGLGTWSP